MSGKVNSLTKAKQILALQEQLIYELQAGLQEAGNRYHQAGDGLVLARELADYGLIAKYQNEQEAISREVATRKQEIEVERRKLGDLHEDVARATERAMQLQSQRQQLMLAVSSGHFAKRVRDARTLLAALEAEEQQAQAQIKTLDAMIAEAS